MSKLKLRETTQLLSDQLDVTPIAECLPTPIDCKPYKWNRSLLPLYLCPTVSPPEMPSPSSLLWSPCSMPNSYGRHHSQVCKTPKMKLLAEHRCMALSSSGFPGKEPDSPTGGPCSFPSSLVPVALIWPQQLVSSPAKYKEDLCPPQRLNRANCLDRS